MQNYNVSASGDSSQARLPHIRTSISTSAHLLLVTSDAKLLGINHLKLFKTFCSD